MRRARTKVVAGGVAVLVTLVLTQEPAIADIPVIDFGAIAQAVRQELAQDKAYLLQAKQYITEQTAWAKQVEQYAVQVQQYATETEQLMAFVHYPNLGAAMGLLNRVGLGDSLPLNPYAMYGLVNGFGSRGGIPSISGTMGQLNSLTGASWASAHVYTPTDGSWSSQQVIARANGIAGVQGAAQASYADLRAHQDTLQSLRDRLATAINPKDVADAQAQIAIEQTWTMNQNGQMAAIDAAYKAQSDSVVQRDNEKIKKDLQEVIDTLPKG
jgi:type IV secretion system protein VirB5